MALTLHALKLLAPILRNKSVLTLGFPDILATPSEASQIIGETVTLESPYGHNHKREAPMCDTREVFHALGCRLACVDLFPTREVEVVVDLNEEGALKSFGLADIVIDAGTIEHCANIGGALKNAADQVTAGGFVFHSPPLSMMNHGFYNISPTLLWDFYEQNGWAVRHCSAFMAKSPYGGFSVSPHARFNAPSNAALYFLAERGDRAPLKWPTQHKYL